MRDYFASKYSPANIVLAFAGKTDWDELVDLAQEPLLRAGQGPPTERQAVPPKGTGAFEALLRAEDNQQTVIGVADAPPLEDDDRYAAQLLATVLGDHTGSRLYWALIDPGHADGAEVSYQDYNQAGAFYTFLSCEPDETQANLGRIVDVYGRGDGRRDHRGRADPGQEQGPGPLRPPLRAADGPAGLARLPLDLSPRIPARRPQELDLFGQVTLDDIRRVLDRWPLLPMTVVSVGPTTDVHPPK